MRYGLIRLDIEDFLTPESDDGLQAMLDQLDRHRLPASYGVVGEKATALAHRGRHELLDRLRQKPALGFHSTSHSRHPTLAEELEPLPYPAGVDRFVERESVGVGAVADLVKAPVYFTQPGGNWVPQATQGLPRMGMELYFSESWNSYLVELTEPVWLAQVLHFSLPVPTPAPFLLGLPNNLDEAISRLRHIGETVPDGGAFTIMTHPTELVATKFWDAVNFAQGKTVQTLRPAPLRSRGERERAIYALDQYFLTAAELPGIEWLDVVTLANRVEPRRPFAVRRDQLDGALRRFGLGPTRLSDGTLSASQWVYLLAYFIAHPKTHEVVVPLVDAPKVWTEADFGPGPLNRPGALTAAAEEVLARVDADRELPARVAGMAIEHFAILAAHRLLALDEATPLTFLSYVKPPEALHWDWPIFAPDFRPYRLWQETRRLAWTIAPVQWKA